MRFRHQGGNRHPCSYIFRTTKQINDKKVEDVVLPMLIPYQEPLFYRLLLVPITIFLIMAIENAEDAFNDHDGVDHHDDDDDVCCGCCHPDDDGTHVDHDHLILVGVGTHIPQSHFELIPTR